jgi:predicted dehydrogenase
MAVATGTLRIGVLGVGRIGRMHAELLERQVPGAAVTAVYDAFEPTAREVAARLGVAMPVTDAVADVLAGRVAIDAAVEALMTRPLRREAG